MNDCPNAEIRDLLPDLLHERLDGDRRAAVLAHVAGCVDCRDELELLRGINGVMLRATPRVDVAAIVARIPAPEAKVLAFRPARRRFASWQIAAAVTLVLAGGTSVLTLSNRAPGRDQLVASMESATVAPPAARQLAVGPAIPAQPVPLTPAPGTAAVQVASAKPSRELGVKGQFADLDEGDLKALLADLDDMEAVPVAEPEPLGLNPPALTPEEER